MSQTLATPDFDVYPVTRTERQRLVERAAS